MIYTGVDLIEIGRIATVRDRYPERFFAEGVHGWGTSLCA